MQGTFVTLVRLVPRVENFAAPVAAGDRLRCQLSLALRELKGAKDQAHGRGPGLPPSFGRRCLLAWACLRWSARPNRGPVAKPGP